MKLKKKNTYIFDAHILQRGIRNSNSGDDFLNYVLTSNLPRNLW